MSGGAGGSCLATPKSDLYFITISSFQNCFSDCDQITFCITDKFLLIISGRLRALPPLLPPLLLPPSPLRLGSTTGAATGATTDGATAAATAVAVVGACVLGGCSPAVAFFTGLLSVGRFQAKCPSALTCGSCGVDGSDKKNCGYCGVDGAASCGS